MLVEGDEQGRVSWYKECAALGWGGAALGKLRHSCVQLMGFC